jgi:P-type Ca2+ transporter type 2C
MSLFQGFFVLLTVTIVYSLSLFRNMGDNEVRAMTFTTLVIANLGLILTNRSWEQTILKTLRSPNAALWWILGGTIVMLGVALYVPFMREFFQFGLLSPIDIVICLGAGCLSVVWFEILKIFTSRKRKIAFEPN